MMSTIDSGHLANTPPDRQCRHTGRLPCRTGLARFFYVCSSTKKARRLNRASVNITDFQRSSECANNFFTREDFDNIAGADVFVIVECHTTFLA